MVFKYNLQFLMVMICVMNRGYELKEVTVKSNAKNNGHYVPGVISRGMLYVSGQLPVDHELGRMVTGDIAEQTRTALANVERVLEAAGPTKERVVLCRVYIPDMADWDTVNQVYREFFGSHKPARVVVPTRELHHGALVEIEAVAEMPEGTV